MSAGSPWRRVLLVVCVAVLAGAVWAVADEGGAGDGERIRQPGDGPADGPPGGDVWPWVQTGVALAVVIGLIFATRYVLRRWGGAPGVAADGGGAAADVLARQPLSARERLYVVRFGERVVLVGSSPSGLAALSELPAGGEARRLLAQVGADGAARTDGHDADAARETKHEGDATP
jgi:flagellar biogenesis protein FliO